jgi:hypothetical protein
MKKVILQLIPIQVIKGWINSLKTMNIAGTTGLGPFSSYITITDSDTGNSYCISNVAVIVENSDNTINLNGGDVICSYLSSGTKYYFSYFIK